MFRIGYGYDVHKLARNEKFVLGGIPLSHYKGTVGHSDGDVLIHAICDSLLGALKLGDIGYHFPDSDNRFLDIDSKVLLEKSYSYIKEKGYRIQNIDSVVMLQKPKIRDYIHKMEQKLATVLDISVYDISIKATTTEKLGFVGRENGIAAQSVALLQRQNTM